MMIEAVKTCFDIALDKPHCTLKIYINVLEGCVAASFRSESMGVRGKGGFINAFKNHSDSFLHQFVLSGGDSQRTFLFAVFLFDVRPSRRVRLVAVVFERGNDFLYASGAHAVDGLSVNPCCHVPLPCADVIVGEVIEFGVIEVVVESLESVRFVV